MGARSRECASESSGAPSGSDGRAAIYGVRPEHFTIADDGELKPSRLFRVEPLNRVQQHVYAFTRHKPPDKEQPH